MHGNKSEVQAVVFRISFIEEDRLLAAMLTKEEGSRKGFGVTLMFPYYLNLHGT